MKTFKYLTAPILLAAMLAVPSQAFAFKALNRLTVNPAGGNQFEVIQRAGSSAADNWCAAADYALRVLGASSSQKVYLVAGRQAARTEGNRFGVTFSLSAPPEAQNFTSQPLTLSLRNIGDSLGVGFARQYCYDRLEEERRIFP